MARILFITQFYPPEVGAAQARISETAECLVQMGHEVSVLTTLPNYPLGDVPPEYQHGARRRQILGGIRVIRVWSMVGPNRGFLRRIVAQFSFGCLAPWLGFRAVGTPDIIIVVSPPLFTSIAARILARLKRRPYIFNVADIWPESAVQLGALHNRLLIWMAERLEWTTYRHASAVWAVTAGIRDTLVRRGLRPDKVFALPTGVDTARFYPMDRVEARRHLGWDDRFIVLYAGTIGLAHGLGTLLDAAQRLLAYPDVHIVLAGEGAARAALEADAARRGLINVSFLGMQPRDEMPVIICAANACVTPLRKLPLFQGALPTKMYEAMACARPIVLAVDGEARRLAEDEAGAAVYAEPENAAALTEAILRLRAHPELGHRLGEHGRNYVVAHLDRGALTAMLDERISSVLARPDALATQESMPAQAAANE